MPLYCFECETCHKAFDELCRWEDRQNVVCPDCGKSVTGVTTAPNAVLFTNLKGTSKEDNFEYVAKENYENALRQRRYAEATNKHSHEYKEINDIDKYEGKMADFDPFEPNK